VLIAVIAAAAQALNGDRQRALAWVADVRRRRPALTRADFFRSFPFADTAVRERLAKALRALEI